MIHDWYQKLFILAVCKIDFLQDMFKLRDISSRAMVYSTFKNLLHMRSNALTPPTQSRRGHCWKECSHGKLCILKKEIYMYKPIWDIARAGSHIINMPNGKFKAGMEFLTEVSSNHYEQQWDFWPMIKAICNCNLYKKTRNLGLLKSVIISIFFIF